MNSELKLFTAPWITMRVPRRLFIELIERLTPMLPSKYALPNPQPDNDYFGASLASVLERPGDLPIEVLRVFQKIEAMAGEGEEETASERLEKAMREWLHASRSDGPSTPSVAVPKNGSDAPDSAVPVSSPPADCLATQDGVGEVSSPEVAHTEGPDGPEVRRATESSLSIVPGSVSSCDSSSQPDALPEPSQEAFARLAKMEPAEYDLVRQEEAERLGLRVRTLDSEVSRARTKLEMEQQARSIKLKSHKPWPEPVSGAEVLEEILGRFKLYAYLPAGGAITCALWTAHVPAFHAFHITPRLHLSSQFGGCGKTTILDIIASLVSRALRFENLSPAVLFRIVNMLQPLLCLDEVDSYLPYNDELRGLLNAGHKRDSHAYRCEGENYTIRAFRAFAPAVLAGLGDLPGTLRDRSIVIHMEPAPAAQRPTRFEPLNLKVEEVIARKLLRWAKDNFAALAACDPPLPATAFNRLADNWRPLFAVAQVAGGDWPGRALEAFNQLATKPTRDIIAILLEDIRALFAKTDATRLLSSQIVAELRALPDRPWSAGNNGNEALTANRLARYVQPLGIRPRLIRIRDERGKGYDRADFALPAEAPPEANLG